MKIHERELEKPCYILKGGKEITLREYLETPGMALNYNNLKSPELEELVIKRLDMEPRDKIIHIGIGSYTIDDEIAEVKKKSKVGRTIIQKEKGFLEWLNSHRKEIEC